MIPSQDVRIYLNPQRFWALTEKLSANEADLLMSKVMRLAEEQRIDELRNYDFIIVKQNRSGSEHN